MTTDATINTTVRLPTELVAKVDALAKEQRRSRNAMITVLLEQAVDQ
jgi:predicted transcriptional regulator